MRLMGIDYGSKRVGIALSDEEGRFAMPHAVLVNNKKLIGTLVTLCKEKRVSRIIVGKSEDYHGESNPIMKKTEVFVKEFRKSSGLPVEFEPEFLTSREATHIQGDVKNLDASAAALILKSYIEKQNESPY